MNRITRIEVIDENGRSYVNWEDDNNVSWQFQDDGRTLKVFVNKVKSKSPVEEAYYSVYGWYPPTTSSVSNYEDNTWSAFQDGYIASQKDYKVGEFQHLNEELLKSKEKEMIKKNLKTSLQELVNGDVRPIDDVVRETKNQQIKELIRESVKWCEKHPDESVEDYLKPKTPEQTEKSLKEAFVKAQQTEEWKETQRKIDAPKESWMNKSDEELVAMLEKNPPDCLKFVMGKTLEQIIERWWCDTFTVSHGKWSMEKCIDDLIDQIELFLPRSQSAEGTQSVYTEVAVEAHNELLQKIKSKLRNKK